MHPGRKRLIAERCQQRLSSIGLLQTIAVRLEECVDGSYRTVTVLIDRHGEHPHTPQYRRDRTEAQHDYERQRRTMLSVTSACERCGGEGDVTDDPDERYERMVCPECGGSGKRGETLV